MPFNLLRYSSFFAAILFAFPLLATESECITATLFGTDTASEDAILQHLKTELRIPIYKGNGPSSCWRLVIELQDKTSKISLARQQEFNTVIHLDDFLPVLWPRVIALSTSGLWILAQDQAHSEPRKKSDNNEKSFPKKDTGNASSKEEEHRHSEINTRPRQTDISTDNSPQMETPNRRVRFHVLTGARLIPKFGVGILELSAGTGISVARVHVDLTIFGLWGRKSLDPGQIITTGGGLRAAVFWQAVKRQNISLGLGPALEVIGVFGYGRGDEGVRPNQAIYPVINCLVLAGGWFDLTPRTAVQMAVGGGLSALYFNMQIDGKAVAGISGGSVNLLFGISIGP